MGGEILPMSGYARFIVGNRLGTILAELDGDSKSITWGLNQVGKTVFSIAANDDKATQENLKIGNRVIIQFENGLPDWGGVIETPRKWDGSNILITVYSAAYLFKYRTTDKGRYFTNQSVGDIFHKLIDEANIIEDTGIDVLATGAGGTLHSPEYHFKSILKIWQESLTKRLSVSDFKVEPFIDTDGKIKFDATIQAVLGMDKTNLALIEGENISDIILVEQGPIVNSWDIAGEGTGWGAERLTANAQDSASRAEFGLREDSRVYGDVKLQETLNEHSKNLLEKSKQPYNIYSFNALDEPPAKFADYREGDRLSLQAPSYGFGGTDTTIRIIGREYYPDSGKCKLAVREWL
jgi:hypothetical protein